MARKTASTPTKPAASPGAAFALPGVTRWTEQQDINNATSSTLLQGSQSPVTGLLPFRTTDIVFAWFWGITLTNTVTPGTSTITTSQYFPYNFLQQFQLLVSNLYDIIDVQSGIDLAIFNTIRPYRTQNMLNAEYTSPSAWPYNPQSNLVSSGSYTSASTSILLKYTIPVSLWFDEYFELDRDGTILAVANRVPVSPFYMSGTARNVQPNIVMAPGSTPQLDLGPFNIGAGTGTFSGSQSSQWRRAGMYGTKQGMEMPIVWNWRYALVSRRFALGAVAQVDIPLKSIINNGGGGQVLMCFFRFFDPAANSGLGAAIDLATIKEGKLLYGSGLIRYDDLPDQNEQRFYEQHNIRLPIGVWCWDMAQDENERITNARALNIYTTDVTVHFDFTVTLSTTAYVVVGVEYLAYVIDEPTIV